MNQSLPGRSAYKAQSNPHVYWILLVSVLLLGIAIGLLIALLVKPNNGTANTNLAATPGRSPAVVAPPAQRPSPTRSILAMTATNDSTDNTLIIANSEQSSVTHIAPTQIAAVPVGVPIEATNTAKANRAFTNYTEKIPGGTVTFDMVAIPGGTINIGSLLYEIGRDSNDMAQVTVSVKPFWMGKYEVTWAEFLPFAFPNRQEVVKARTNFITFPDKPYGSIYRGHGQQGFPAIGMSQRSATEFCRWLSWKTGKKYRLPTEAEWEYACRAGAETPYFWGASADQAREYAWFSANSQGTTQPCGKLKPNNFGLHDIVGNVAEWTQLSAIGAPGVVRGGAYLSNVDGLRSASRMIGNPVSNLQNPQTSPSIWWLPSADFIGFRVMRSADEASITALAANRAASSGGDNYRKFCAGCHGITGKGDTVLGKRANTRDYTDAVVQATLTDDAMIKAIKEGLTVEDKHVMTAYADKLTDAEIKALVDYMKAFKSTVP